MLCELELKNKKSTKNGKIFFYGVSGCGMTALAQWYLDQGRDVCGWDDKASGCFDSRIHFAPLSDWNNITQVCVSSALQSTHPFYKMMQSFQGKVLSRPDLLKEIISQHDTIAVTGTHGKTTTTTLISYLLDRVNQCANYLIGGKRIDTNRYGSFAPASKLLVVEADESTCALSSYHPKIAVILNAFTDHLENFSGSQQAYQDNIRQFGLQSQVLVTTKTVWVKLFSNYAAGHWKQVFLLSDQGIQLVGHDELFQPDLLHVELPLCLQTPYSWQHIYSAVAVGWALGQEKESLTALLEGFQGVVYRLERLRLNSYPNVWRDYGHHPNELKNVAQTLNQAFPDLKKVIVFQPHKYSRTKNYFEKFIEVLSEYDQVFLLPTHEAGEPYDGEADTQALAKHIQGAICLNSLDDFELDAPERSTLLFQGAGSIMQDALTWKEKQS